MRVALGRGPATDKQWYDLGRTDKWEAIAAFASRSLLAPALYVALSEKKLLGGVPHDFADFLESIYEANAERNRELVRETVRIVTLLAHAGIEPPVLLKGIAYLATGVIEHPGARYIGDIDLLLAPAQAEEAVRILLRSGMGCVRTTASPLDCTNGYHYSRLCGPEGRVGVEVHRAVPSEYAVLCAEDVLRGSRPATLAGAAIRVPGPDHLALHHILHAQAGPYWQMRPPLRHVRDMALIAARFGEEIDWKRIAQLFRDAGMQSVLETWTDVTEWLCGVQLPFELPSTLRRRLRSRRVIGLCSSRPLRIIDPGYVSLFLWPYLRNGKRLALAAEGRRLLLRKICDRTFYSRILMTYTDHGK